MAKQDPKQLYLLVHAYKGGESTEPFFYQPVKEAPYPDICAVTKQLRGDMYKPEEGDCLQLIEVGLDMAVDVEGAVGCADLREFHEGELVWDHVC